LVERLVDRWLTGGSVQDEDGVAWSFMLNYTNISFGTYG
jgi:hypothetical protein